MRTYSVILELLGCVRINSHAAKILVFSISGIKVI